VRPRRGRVEQVVADPALANGRAVGAEGERAVLLGDGRVALAVRHEPDARFEAESANLAREPVHAQPGESALDDRPVAVLGEAAAPVLPTVVHLHIAGAVRGEVLGDPAGVGQHLGRADLPVVVVPRAPPRRRQREGRLVHRPVELDAEVLLEVAVDDRAVGEGDAIMDRVERAVGERGGNLAQCEHEEIVAAGWLAAHGDRARPRADGPVQVGLRRGAPAPNAGGGRGDHQASHQGHSGFSEPPDYHGVPAALGGAGRRLAWRPRQPLVCRRRRVGR